MTEIDFEKIGLKVGLEIHQQLDTHKKLFCKCRPVESDEYTEKFSRSLRTAKSELGELDPAALFEKAKSKKINYYANSQSSCLVEKDDEPPHELDHDAKKISLLISSMLESKIFSEIHVMRKTVIDGSNTSGFQRTMLVSQGGNLKVNGKNVGVQAVCLEEDAAKLLKDEQNERNYSLDRLGIPLVEIALEPVSTKPSEVKEIALTLGRLLRATRMVKRGIGSIRQDVNISVMNSGVVEVKGVQQLDQLEKIIGYEAKRQHGLILIAEKLKKLSMTISNEDVFDITEVFKDCESKIIQNALKSKAKIKAIRVRNFLGMFSFEPYSGIRLGKEIGQLVRFFGIGGVFHSDELPNYGINDSDVDRVKKHLELADGDGFLIIAGEDSKLDYAIDSIIKRIQDAANGVPAETRAVTQDGETVFLRPRPGASRMYPETDIPSISVIPEEVKLARDTADATKSWDESIAEIQQKYSLNSQLSEQIFDSVYMELFEKICENKKNSPNFVASILCSSITNLERKGFDCTLLKPEHIIESFELLASGKIPKESLEIIFENIMSGKSENVAIAMQNTDVSSMNEDELNGILDEIIQNNTELVKKLGENAVTTLMGIAMKQVRGKVSGQTVNVLLRKKISEL
ncbi:Glu-tRNA(Gln) amidotransferase subunit GatE [Marine Group I thaumarchaeote]|uniref:Glutamyl-tRNA(Gln) amidotransferase subunit E n=1 Tax=Marine Group I thaumarchaeote TaxID=2511932 RepID=A0A7K4NF38_9ARCH|nr:Glu-tRNA(Gln) amidotransferase subunit GatE [Marine Group I thaumarchaeote]